MLPVTPAPHPGPEVPQDQVPTPETRLFFISRNVLKPSLTPALLPLGFGGDRWAWALGWVPLPYLVPFFFEKVFLTLRWRLLSSKAANPPLSRVTDSSMLEMLLPTGGGEGADASGSGRLGPRP